MHRVGVIVRQILFADAVHEDLCVWLDLSKSIRESESVKRWWVEMRPLQKPAKSLSLATAHYVVFLDLEIAPGLIRKLIQELTMLVQ